MDSKSLRRWYVEKAETLPCGGDFKADWKWLVVLALIVYAVNFGVRLVDYPKWEHPALWVGQERIMATHDTYAWLAGAKGVGDYVGYPFTEFTQFLAQATGASLGQVGFWTTGIISSLVGVVVLLWGWLLGGRTAGVLAGMIGGLAPGFYFRSRLGYHDTDMFTLLVPLFVAWALALLLGPHLGTGWLPGRREGTSGDGDGAQLGAREAWLAFGLGTLVNFAERIHLDVVHVDKIIFWIALVGAMLMARRGSRLKTAKLLCVFAAAAFLGYYQIGFPLSNWVLLVQSFLYGSGAEASNLPSACFLVGGFLAYMALPIAAGLAWAFSSRHAAARAVAGRTLPFLALLAFVLIFGDLIPAPSTGGFGKVLAYFKPVAETPLGPGREAVQHPVFPAIAQSIREARNVPWSDTLGRMAPTPWLGWLGLGCFFAVLAFRPTAALLLPLLGIALAGLWLGVRFTMFGGPALALGLGVCLEWLARRFLAERTWRGAAAVGAQVVLGLALALPLLNFYRDLPPSPVLSKLHAEGLIRLKSMAPHGSQVWTWWDYGYATQYYAGLMTPSDGGRHGGQDIYPTAMALTTSSPRFANQLIKYSATQGNNPGAAWAKMPAAEVRAFLDSLKTEDVQLPKAAPQYLVVAWDNINLTGWISFYGTWDVVTGQGVRARAESVETPFQFEPQPGVMAFRDGSPPLPVRSIDIVGLKGRRSHTYEANMGPHLVVNADLNAPVLMDDLAYKSMLVRLLIDDSNLPDIAKYFRLVVELAPHARIYEVL